MKKCPTCKVTKKISLFNKDRTRKDGLFPRCTKCLNIKAKRYREKNREIIKLKRREYIKNFPEKGGTKYFRERRRRAITAYGGKCACCGESCYEFLTFDHVDNDGAEHRRNIGNNSKDIVSWAIKNDYPNNLQILCYNCNCAKGFHGECPHKLKINQ